jgi:hypothetical protein
MQLVARTSRISDIDDINAVNNLFKEVDFQKADRKSVGQQYSSVWMG